MDDSTSRRTNPAARSLSLEKGLAVLDLLDAEDGLLGVREIARRLDMAPAVAQRLIATLLEHGYLAQDPQSRRYRLGYRAASLGARLLESDLLVASAMPELRRLADEHLLNGFLGVLAQDRLLYVLSVQSSGPVAIRNTPGMSASLHSTAMGKALLAGLGDADLDEMLARLPLPRLTDRTITDRTELRCHVVAAREDGYATCIEENLPGIHSAAAIVRDRNGASVAALSMAFSPQTSPQHDIAAVARLARAASLTVSRRLGYAPPATAVATARSLHTR